MITRIFTINFFAVAMIMLSAAVGGIIAGLTSSKKNFLDLIWLLN